MTRLIFSLLWVFVIHGTSSHSRSHSAPCFRISRGLKTSKRFGRFRRCARYSHFTQVKDFARCQPQSGLPAFEYGQLGTALAF
jgi:hypothetical protein